MYGVFSCFDLTESNVVLVPQRVNRQAFHRIPVHLTRICNNLKKFYFFYIFINSVSLSSCTFAMKVLSGRVCGYFENLCIHFMFHLRLRANCKSGILEYSRLFVCLSFRPSIILSERNNSFTRKSFHET